MNTVAKSIINKMEKELKATFEVFIPKHEKELEYLLKKIAT